MKPRAVWMPEAQDDLAELVYYIAVVDGRPLVAEKIAREIQEACDRYANYPEVGEVEPRLSEHCRRFTHKRWVILYRPIEDGIAVLRVVDGARDFNRLFETS